MSRDGLSILVQQGHEESQEATVKAGGEQHMRVETPSWAEDEEDTEAGLQPRAASQGKQQAAA
jgi:hypothetical protein